MNSLNESVAIPENVVAEWTEITNLMADSCGVVAGLVMRGNESTMEVMAKSDSGDNPYEAGETAPRNNDLYCETVIATNKPLSVLDCKTDSDWQGNPDEALGMVSYYGVPVNWPGGENFGTICILDNKSKQTSELEQRLMSKLAKLIEYSLEKLYRESLREGVNNSV